MNRNTRGELLHYKIACFDSENIEIRIVCNDNVACFRHVLDDDVSFEFTQDMDTVTVGVRSSCRIDDFDLDIR